MHCAAYIGHLAIAKRLLEGGADVTLRYNGKTAIDEAREQGWSEVVALLSEPRYADGDRTECEPNAKSIANRMKTRKEGRRRLGRARGPRFICRSANESRRAAMGCGREVATHALWGDTAPRRRTPIRFYDWFRMGKSQAPCWAHRESVADSRPSLPHSLRLRPAAPAAPQTVAPRRVLKRALGRSLAHS